MKRSNKIIEVSGVKVIGKESAITKIGKYAGKSYWVLLVICETYPEIKEICVFDDCIGNAGEISAEKIMNDVEKSNYADKRYLFYVCQRIVYGGFKWDLVGWKELERK